MQSSHSQIPEEITSQLKTAHDALDGIEDVLKNHLNDSSPLINKANKDQFTHLQIAELRLHAAKTIVTLFKVLLQSKGIDPSDHDIKKEEIKLKQYEKKVRKALAIHELHGTSKKELTMDAATIEKFVTAASTPTNNNTNNAKNSRGNNNNNNNTTSKSKGTKRSAAFDTYDDDNNTSSKKSMKKGKGGNHKDAALQFLHETMTQAKKS